MKLVQVNDDAENTGHGIENFVSKNCCTQCMMSWIIQNATKPNKIIF